MAARDSLAEVDAGAFKRSASTLRDWVGAPDGRYPVEAGRYVLYISWACPWASRCAAVRALRGLEHAVDLAVVAPIWDATKPGVDDHRGWVFPADPRSEPAATPDPVFGARTIRDVYDRSVANGGAQSPKFTVPVLLDRRSGRIVNNESTDIVRMFGAAFSPLAKRPEVDLYPEALRAEIDSTDADVYTNIADGVYKCGFARSQQAYDAAVTALFDGLDRMDARLATRRFLCGDALTEADLRLAMTLFRFDAVYATHFKCNKKLIREYANLQRFT
jgi:putative glutathione S-transferase